MMSVAGGWFFLMACEMFVLGNRDFRLPGLGSYLQTAANAGDTRAIFWGLMTMIGVIILIDQLVWRPVIAWAEKFKVEQVGSAEIPRSPILTLLRSSKLLPLVTRSLVLPLRERLDLHFAKEHETRSLTRGKSRVPHWALRAVAVVVLTAIAYAVAKVFSIMATMSSAELRHIVWGAGATFLRVEAVLLLAALWTVPAGVAIGLRPRLSAIAQPIAQIAASVPATALFPIILLVLIRAGGGLGIGSIVFAAPGHAVVHVVQRDCWCDGDTGGFEGSLQYVPTEHDPALAKAIPACHISLLDHRFRHRLGRGMECKHRGGILPLPRPNHLDYRSGRNH